MNRYFAVGIMSLGVSPLLLSWPPDEKVGIGYFHLMRAALFPPQDARLDSIKTEKEYLAALRAAEEKIFQNEFEAEFLLLLDKQQTQEYDSLATLEARRAYIENYWKAANPNPLLPENDWLVDVLKRRAYARENFPAPAPPYFDDRGKYYLKYGKPRSRFIDAGAPNIYRNESWSYENVTHNFLVHFVQDGLTFRETDNLLSFYEGGKFRNPEFHPEQWSKMVTQRATVSPVFARAYAKIQELATARLHAQTFSNSHTALGIELRQPQTILQAIYHQATVEVTKAKNACPPAAHDEINAVNKLKFFETLAQFRAPDGNTCLEVALLSPLEKNIVKSILRRAADTLRLTCSGLVSNEKFDGIAKDEAVIQYPLKLIANEKNSRAVGRLTFFASPQEGDITLQIKDERSGKTGFSRQALKIRDFRGSTLMLSDIQFLTEATNAKQRQILPVITRLNTLVAPYPFEEIRPSNPLLCYFEIYNLRTAGVTEEYEIVYKIISEKGGNKGVAVSVSSTRAVSNDTAPELIGIDLRKVPKGKHRLEITVTAMNDRNITASIQKEIRIDD